MLESELSLVLTNILFILIAYLLSPPGKFFQAQLNYLLFHETFLVSRGRINQFYFFKLSLLCKNLFPIKQKWQIESIHLSMRGRERIDNVDNR